MTIQNSDRSNEQNQSRTEGGQQQNKFGKDLKQNALIAITAFQRPEVFKLISQNLQAHGLRETPDGNKVKDFLSKAQAHFQSPGAPTAFVHPQSGLNDQLWTAIKQENVRKEVIQTLQCTPQDYDDTVNYMAGEFGTQQKARGANPGGIA